jgi:K+ transporter
MLTIADTHGPGARPTAQAAVVVGALGVVFGDIGTSPIYTVQTVFNPSDPHPVPVNLDNVYGIISLIFWSVTIIVTLTYVTLITRADNDGEGGIMALITLISRKGAPGGPRAAMVLAALGIFGASLFFGDSMITPAISVLTLVFAFESSAALAFAFGMAVTGTITITTLLFFYVVWRHWPAPLWLVALGAGVLLLIDLLFLAANLTKLVHGAWLPLLIGVTGFTVMTTWQRGRGLVTRQRELDEGSLREFITELHDRQPPLPRVAGTAVFLNRGKETAPLAMRSSVEHYRVLHEHVVIMSVETQPVPRVPASDRLVIDDLGYTDDGITHVSARFGYMESPNVPEVVRLLESAEIECPIEVDTASYFVSTIELRRGTAPTMAPWRKRLFLATSGITADAAEYFNLPRDRTLIIGSHVEV